MKNYLPANKFYFFKLLLFIVAIPNFNCTGENKIKNKLSVLYSFQKKDEVKPTQKEGIIIRENETLSQVFDRVKTSVFLIIAQNANNISQGSGFFINSSGIGISNYHVFEGHNSAFIKLFNGNKYSIVDILEKNIDLDYIIFKVENLGVSFDKVNIASTNASIGESCFAIGNPQGLEQTLTNGIISAYRRNNNIIQTNTDITHGSSGGTLFNSKGELIGMTSSGIAEGNLNFSLNIHSIPFEKYLNE